MASPRAVLAGASAAQAAVSLVGFGLPAIGPELRAAYGLTLPELGAVLTVNLLGSGLFLIAAGFAVDRYGVRRPLLAGSALAVAGLAAAAFAPTGLALIGALFVSGVGAAVVPIAGAGALFHAYDVDRRAFALGVRQMGVPLGGTVAAVLLPALAALGGIRLSLLCSAAVLALAGLAFAVVVDAEQGAEKPPPLALRRICCAPGMQRLLVVAALYIVVLQAVLTYTVPAVREAGLSPLVAGATFFLLNVTAGVARIIWGRVADRNGGTGRVRALVSAGWLAALGAVAFTFALHGGAAAVVPAAIVLAFGALGWNALVYVTAGEKSPSELAAQGVAVAATVVFVFSAVSTPPLGALAEHAGWDAFWLATGALAAVGALVAATLPSPPVASPGSPRRFGRFLAEERVEVRD